MVSHILRAIMEKEMDEMQVADKTKSGEAVCIEPPEISLSPTVGTIFDNVKEYEQVCSNLPSVPTEKDEVIESRLFKLKSFNKALEENVETSEEVSNEVNRRFEKIKNNGLKAKSDEDRVKVEEIKPVFATKEDTDAFNEWYWQEVDNQNEKRKVNTKFKLQLSDQDEEKSKLFDKKTSTPNKENCDLYKQLYMPECFPKSKHNGNGITTTTVLCYLQTYFMLLVAVHQSLNDKMVEISKHSQFQLPITPFPHTNFNNSSSSSSTTSSLAPCSCAGPSPPQWGGCQSPGYAWERSGCMCMLVGGLFMRTVGKL